MAGDESVSEDARNPLGSLADLAGPARRAASALAATTSDVKDGALRAMAGALRDRAAEVLEANAKDLEGARADSAPPAVLEREVSIQATVPGARLLVNGEDRGAIPQKTLKFPHRPVARLSIYRGRIPRGIPLELSWWRRSRAVSRSSRLDSPTAST